MFNPYWTAPDRAGNYYWFMFMKCGDCCREFHLTGPAHINDGGLPQDLKDWLSERGIIWLAL